ncbi:lycopene cyclase domain-containing protein [Arthrobacter sp. H20]|uniref:lycopene cyclase domain-containing protein n=1 Tax=Arthrobacter sp. H20 TaxID=1267981 RepID=UPI00047B5718|nr:lycopene cyclase domain-containing protein [Arthrobacter sp. H20]
MTSLLYLACLVGSLAVMGWWDRQDGLFFWAAPRRAALVMALGVAFFLAWDVGGIGLGIFYRGDSELMTGVLLAPELPLEELFFLTFLCWLTMNLYVYLTRRLEARVKVAQ